MRIFGIILSSILLFGIAFAACMSLENLTNQAPETLSQASTQTQTGTNTSNTTDTLPTEDRISAYPEAHLAGAPAKITDSTSMYIVVTGQDLVAYKYKLDKGTYGPKTAIETAIEAANLPAGEHSISIIAQNKDGIWQDEATTYSWTITEVIPLAELSGCPVDTMETGSAEIHVSGTELVEYQFQLDDAGYSTSRSTAVSIVFNNLTDGEHTLDVLGKTSDGIWQIEPTSCTWTVDLPEPTVEEITGTLSINNGAEFCTSENVSLTISGSTYSEAGFGWMRFKNEEAGDWSDWEVYNTTFSWALDATEGEHEVFVELMDADGHNTTEDISDSIYLDLNAPIDGTVIINNDDASTTDLNVSLSLTGDDGTGSGIVAMQLQSDSGEWSDWMPFTGSYAYTLDEGAFGVRTVSMNIKDAAGYVSGPFFDTITYAGNQVYVSTTGDDVSNDGLSPSAPVATITKGIEVADTESITQVAVAQGSYSDSIHLMDSISLYGGYAPDFSSRDAVSNQSVVLTSGTNLFPITAEPGVTADTVVDGFEFHAPGTASDTNYAFYMEGGNATIRNCTLINECTSAVPIAYGLYMNNTTGIVTMYDSIVTVSATGPTENTGIYVGQDVGTNLYRGTVTVDQNEAKGVYVYNAAGALIQGYRVQAPSTTIGIGIRIENSTFKVDGCYINGGNNLEADHSKNIGVQIVGCNPTLINNIIYGTLNNANDYRGRARGVSIHSGSPVLSNNLIYGGRRTSHSSSSQSLYRYGLIIYGGHPIVINNIFRSYTYYEYYNRYIYQYGVFESGENSSPSLFLNNLFFTNSEWQHYHDGNGRGNLTSAGEMNSAYNTTQGFSDTAGGNIEASVGDTLVSEYSDHHLQATAPAIDAGLDTSSFAYGEVLTDYDGNPRVAPYDIGPFEYTP